MRNANDWPLLAEEIQHNLHESLLDEHEIRDPEIEDGQVWLDCPHDDVGLEPVEPDNPTSSEQYVCRRCCWPLPKG